MTHDWECCTCGHALEEHGHDPKYPPAQLRVMYGNAIASPLRPEKTVAMMMMKTALKKVVTFEYEGACRYTGYLDKSIRLTLECGHEMVRKASAGVPGKARCYFCDRDATSVIDRLVKAGLTPQ